MLTGMKVQYFTYFLNPLQQPTLGLTPPDTRDKNEILRDLLSTKKLFHYKGKKGSNLAFKIEKVEGKYIFARLAKQAGVKTISSPEKDFEEMHQESWPNCVILINTDNDSKTGQKILFEVAKSIFPSPYESLKVFADELNAYLFGFGYAISIHPVTEEADFWKIVDEHQGDIEKLELNFSAPNLLNLEGELTDALKALEKEYGSTDISLGLANPVAKLRVPKNNLMKQSAKYASGGGAEFIFHIRGKKKISSKDKIKVREIAFEADIVGSNQQTFFDILGSIFK